MQHSYLWGLIVKKTCTSFLNDAQSLTTYGCALWCSQIVYIRHCSLNTQTTFYFATECSDVTAFVEGVCMSQHFRTWPDSWPGLGSVSYSGCSVVPSVTDKRTIVSVTLLFYSTSKSLLIVPVFVFINLHWADCVFVFCGLSACYKTLKLKKMK